MKIEIVNPLPEMKECYIDLFFKEIGRMPINRKEFLEYSTKKLETIKNNKNEKKRN